MAKTKTELAADLKEKHGIDVEPDNYTAATLEDAIGAESADAAQVAIDDADDEREKAAADAAAKAPKPKGVRAFLHPASKVAAVLVEGATHTITRDRGVVIPKAEFDRLAKEYGLEHEDARAKRLEAEAKKAEEEG